MNTSYLIATEHVKMRVKSEKLRMNQDRMARSGSPTFFNILSRGVYRQEFVANEVKKSWSWSYKIIFLLILHIQIEELNYRLLTVLD